MLRTIVLAIVSITLLLGLSGGTPRSFTSVAGASTPTPTPPAELCPTPSPTVEGATAVPAATPVPFLSAIEVHPASASAAVVPPPPDAPDDDQQSFYLVTWTLEPGTCIPFTAEGNMKDGKVILMVQQGTIEFTAEPYGDNEDVKVFWGAATDAGAELAFDQTQPLNPGDWVSMSGQVWFTYTNIGEENSVVYKAVWADLGDDHGCGGGCK